MTALAVCGVGAAACGAWAAVYYPTYAVRSQVLGRTLWQGRTDTSRVALTFDDGPSDDTERVLDVLAEHSVTASFFVIGRNVERHPQIAKRIVSEGHDIGNHSYSHPIFLYVTPSRTREELERTQRVISDTVGVVPEWSRPPCGVRTPAYFSAARALGLRTIQWSVAGHDWRPRSARDISATVLRGCTAGAIVLLHDADAAGRSDRRMTVEALPTVILGLAARGLRPAPVSQLIPGSVRNAHA